MEIKKAKELCREYDILKSTVSTIDRAIENRHWLKIMSPSESSYLSDVQIKSVRDLAKSRIEEIERKFKDE